MENIETEADKCFIINTWENVRKQRKLEKNKTDIEKEDMEGKTDNKDTAGSINKENSKKVTFKDMKATDLKNNKRIVIYAENDEELEIRNNYIKKEFMKVAEKFIKEK